MRPRTLKAHTREEDARAMAIALFVVGVLMAIWGGVVYSEAEVVTHQIIGLIIAVSASVLCAAGAIVERLAASHDMQLRLEAMNRGIAPGVLRVQLKNWNGPLTAKPLTAAAPKSNCTHERTSPAGDCYDCGKSGAAIRAETMAKVLGH